MIKHRVYSAIVNAIREGRLQEPFSTDDFRSVCNGFGDGTYKAFLYKHRRYNLNGNTELFEKIGRNKFKIIRPLKYDL